MIFPLISPSPPPLKKRERKNIVLISSERIGDCEVVPEMMVVLANEESEQRVRRALAAMIGDHSLSLP